MARFVVTFESRGLVSGVDAKALTVRVSRDGEMLGLFATEFSGIDLATRVPRRISTSLVWARAAELLVERIAEDARTRRLRTEWAAPVVQVPVSIDDLAERLDRSGAPMALPRDEGAVLAEFEA